MLGTELKSLRERVGVTLEDVARLTARSRSHISKLENRAGGQMAVPDGLLSDLLQALLELGYDRDAAVTSALRELNERRAQLAGAGASARTGGRD